MITASVLKGLKFDKIRLEAKFGEDPLVFLSRFIIENLTSTKNKSPLRISSVNVKKFLTENFILLCSVRFTKKCPFLENC